MINQCCGTCNHYVPETESDPLPAECLCPLPPWACDHVSYKAGDHFMQPDEGTDCPCYEPREATND